MLLLHLFLKPIVQARLPRPAFLRMLCALACCFAKPASGATSWQIAADAPAHSLNVMELKERFPDISSPDSLSALLRAIALQLPMAQVEAIQDDEGTVVIRFVPASIIGRIEVTSLTRKLRNEIEGKLGKYTGQTDSQEVRLQIRGEVESILRSEGYFLANINISSLIEEGRNVYKIEVVEDYPCTIAKVNVSFRLPRGIENPFKVGMICSNDELRIQQNELEQALIEAGYNQQRIQSPELEFDAATNTAVLWLKGSIGRKVKFRVNSPIKTPGLIGLIFGDDLNSIDSNIAEPDAIASELSRNYRAQGYDDVEISPPRSSNPEPETIEYVFDVKPGPEYYITEVQFEGLAAMNQGEVLDAMELYPSLGNTPIFSQDVVRQARDSLVAYYKSKGFWDAQVFDPRVIKNPATGEVKVVYVIREGKRRIFEDLVIAGNRAIKTDLIEEMFPLSPPQPLSWQELIEFEKMVRNLYRKQGYLDVKMNIELIQNRQFRDIETRIILTVYEGPRTRFGDVNVKGLVKTDLDVVTRELRFKAGDWFDPDLIEESRQALIDLGLFSSVSISPSEGAGDAKNTISYTVLLREARSGTVSFGPGWSLGEGLRFSVESSYNNIAGTGRKVFSKGLLNQEKDQTPLGTKTLLGRYAGVGYVEPYLLDYPVDGTLTFNHKATAQEKSWEISRSAEATALHRLRGFSPKTSIEAFTLYKETREEAEGSVKKATLMESGNLQIREIGLRHTSDARNNLAWPTRGYRLATELSYAGLVFGGGLRYMRWSLGYNFYRQIVPDLVFATGFTLTSYASIERKDNPNVLPSTERLQAGGAESNRGFRENNLGPVFITGENQQIFDGGSRRGIYRLELRYQLISETLAITSFIDSSNSSFSKQEERLIRQEFAQASVDDQVQPQLSDNEPYAFEAILSHPRYLWTKNYLSYGLALNYLTPLGSVNLSFGWPWRRCLNDQSSCAYPRGNSTYRQLTGAVIGLNIGANF